MVTGSSSESTIGMDWSKQPGKSGIECTADDFREHEVGLASPFIVVHGAGKFFGNPQILILEKCISISPLPAGLRSVYTCMNYALSMYKSTIKFLFQCPMC